MATVILGKFYGQKFNVVKRCGRMVWLTNDQHTTPICIPATFISEFKPLTLGA